MGVDSTTTYTVTCDAPRCAATRAEPSVKCAELHGWIFMGDSAYCPLHKDCVRKWDFIRDLAGSLGNPCDDEYGWACTELWEKNWYRIIEWLEEYAQMLEDAE